MATRPQGMSRAQWEDYEFQQQQLLKQQVNSNPALGYSVTDVPGNFVINGKTWSVMDKIPGTDQYGADWAQEAIQQLKASGNIIEVPGLGLLNDATAQDKFHQLAAANDNGFIDGPGLPLAVMGAVGGIAALGGGAAAAGGAESAMGTGAFDMGGLTGTGIPESWGLGGGNAAWGVNPQFDGLTGLGDPQYLSEWVGTGDPGALPGGFQTVTPPGVPGSPVNPGFNLLDPSTYGGSAANAGGSLWDSLSKIFSPQGGGGNGGMDWMRALGTIGATGLGVLGSNAQQDAFRDVSNQYLALGAPYRDRLNASYQPGFDLKTADPLYAGALSQSANEAARAASSRFGNPSDNPGAMAEIQQSIMNRTALPYAANYRGQLGQFGGLGLNTSAQASLAGASGADDLYRNLAGGLGDLTTPKNDWEEMMKRYGGMFGGNLRLNTGGPV